jgi:hypothetical protein
VGDAVLVGALCADLGQAQAAGAARREAVAAGVRRGARGAAREGPADARDRAQGPQARLLDLGRREVPAAAHAAARPAGDHRRAGREDRRPDLRDRQADPRAPADVRAARDGLLDPAGHHGRVVQPERAEIRQLRRPCAARDRRLAVGDRHGERAGGGPRLHAVAAAPVGGGAVAGAGDFGPAVEDAGGPQRGPVRGGDDRGAGVDRERAQPLLPAVDLRAGRREGRRHGRDVRADLRAVVA